MALKDNQQFAVWDWVVFGGMLAVSAGIGIYYAFRDRQKTSRNFMMGGSHMQLLPIAISILVSFMSAILILGTPAEMYTAGTMFFNAIFGITLGALLSTVTFLPLLYPLKLTSSLQYLELRFRSKAARLTGTMILNVQQIFYMGVAMFAPSTALEAVTGFPTWATIVTVGCGSTFYTSLGGMKAVIWTDVFQSLFMITGLLVILIQGTMKVGSFPRVWEINEQWGRIDFWEVDPSLRHSVWSLVIGGGVHWFSRYGVSQPSVQRYSTLQTLNRSRMAMLLNIPLVFVLFAIACLCGIVMFAFYADAGCDPLRNGKISNSNQLVPFFMMEILNYPGIPGLFVACLFSGALSTMSSCLNALSSVTWEDCLKPLVENRFSDTVNKWIIKILVLLYGGAGIGFAFIVKNFGGTVMQIAISFDGGASGPLLGIFLLGALFPWANWLGCVTGGILGLVLPVWMSFGSYNLRRTGYSLDFPTTNCSAAAMNETLITEVTTLAQEPTGLQSLYRISYLWYPAIGLVTSVIVGLIVSFITGPMKVGETDPKYLIPFFDRLCCCLPGTWRQTLRCNQIFQNPQTIIPGEDKDDAPEDTAVKEKSESWIDATYPDMAADITDKNGAAIISYRRYPNKEFVYNNYVFHLDETPTLPS